MSHIEKYKIFYEENGLNFIIDPMSDIPIANGIDCMCDNPKGCGYSCHSGTPCEQFKPNERFYIWQKSEGLNPSEVDYEHDYFAPVKSASQLKIEELEARIQQLEKAKQTEVKTTK